MKNIKYNIFLKTVIFIFCVILFISTAFMSVTSVVLIAISDGSNSPEIAQKELANYYLNSRSNQLFYHYAYEVERGYNGSSVEQWAENEDFYFIISDNSGNILVSNYEGQEYKYKHRNFECQEYYDNETVSWICEEYYVDTFLKTDDIKNEFYIAASKFIDNCFSLKEEFIVFSFINIIIIIGMIVYLCSSAGHSQTNDKIYLNFLNRIPLDIFTAFYLLFISGEILLWDLFYSDQLLFTSLFTFSAFVLIDFVLLLYFIISIAVRVKTKTLIKNTVIYKVFSYIFKYVKIIFKKVFLIIKNIPLIPKTAIVTILIFLLNWILLDCWGENDSIILLFVEGLILIPILFYFVICLKKLQNAGQRIAEGDLEHQVDTSYMIADFKKYGETLNHIGEGLSKAVNEKIKSERFKTELITNVSHDIKTPLTSIINYVDLIKKENPENDTVREYINILERQSNRLKKLIEDLIEASKASTGNILVEKVPCELDIFLSQVVGEFDERAKLKNLDVIVENYREPITVMADRKHLWRVFDNLMSNICKYSQSGTRVYLSLDKMGNRAVVTFRNISENRLSISSDELTERFVRGDSSRNTEGSGLGLSIAKSLVELQGGELCISIDGDLFKVVVSFMIKE